MAVGDVEDVHEPPAVGGDVGLLDGQVEVGEHLHRLEQDAPLPRDVLRVRRLRPFGVAPLRVPGRLGCHEGLLHEDDALHPSFAVVLVPMCVKFAELEHERRSVLVSIGEDKVEDWLFV